MLRATTVAAAALLTAAGLVHVFWAVGGLWPARDERSLAQAVVGPKQEAMPGAALTLAVAALLVAAAVIVVARAGWVDLPGPAWIVRIGAWTIVGVLTVRGVAGLVTSLLADSSQTFHRLDLVVYSPLCLLIAACCLPAARA